MIRKIAMLLSIVVLLIVFCSGVALAQINYISTVGDQTAGIPLFKEEGKEFKRFAIVEIKGSVGIGADGIVNGADSFLRLQLLQDKDKWLKITKRELVQGRLVVTTENGDMYTIWGLNPVQYIGKIALGKYLEKK